MLTLLKSYAKQQSMESIINCKFGTSQTLSTFSFVILLNPVYVAYRLFIAYLISPKIIILANLNKTFTSKY